MIALLSLAVAGCATKARPEIDMAGVDMAQYEKDFAECETAERKSRPRAGEQIRGGAAMAETENSSSEGPVTLEQCLQGRGYSLLN